jgi:hypothetical protein
MYVSQLRFVSSELTGLYRLNARESIRDRGSIVSVALISYVVQFFIQTQKVDQTYSLEIRLSTDNDVQGGDDATTDIRSEKPGQSSPGEVSYLAFCYAQI